MIGYSVGDTFWEAQHVRLEPFPDFGGVFAHFVQSRGVCEAPSVGEPEGIHTTQM